MAAAAVPPLGAMGSEGACGLRPHAGCLAALVADATRGAAEGGATRHALAAVASASIRTAADFLGCKLPAVADGDPELAQRMADLRDALLAHRAVDKSLGVHHHNLGVALAAARGDLPAQEYQRLRKVQRRGNQARHQPWGGVQEAAMFVGSPDQLASIAQGLGAQPWHGEVAQVPSPVADTASTCSSVGTVGLDVMHWYEQDVTPSALGGGKGDAPVAEHSGHDTVCVEGLADAAVKQDTRDGPQTSCGGEHSLCADRCLGVLARASELACSMKEPAVRADLLDAQLAACTAAEGDKAMAAPCGHVADLCGVLDLWSQKLNGLAEGTQELLAAHVEDVADALCEPLASQVHAALCHVTGLSQRRGASVLIPIENVDILLYCWERLATALGYLEAFDEKMYEGCMSLSSPHWRSGGETSTSETSTAHGP